MKKLPFLAALALLASGCSTYFTGQVRGIGLRYDVSAVSNVSNAPNAPVAPPRMRRTVGGRFAQVLLPVAWVLDGAASTLEVVGLASTVASWRRVVP